MYSLLPNHLPRLRRFSKLPILRKIYYSLSKVWQSDGPPVRARIHGFEILLNRGNVYPFIIHEFPMFNAPLVELVATVARFSKEPICFVDVGAATGDTVLLLEERCPNRVGKYICVEGDSEFHRLLLGNMQQFPKVAVVNALLARQSGEIRSLVKHHLGTAAAIGEGKSPAVALDSLEEVRGSKIDILKIDVDGFDGEVLAGSEEVLLRCRPLVIFEWHPKLIQATGNSALLAFETLDKCGYDRFVWYDNMGSFSHFSRGCCLESLEATKKYLLAVNSRRDAHFDVIALPHDSNMDEVELAELSYARDWLKSKGVSGGPK